MEKSLPAKVVDCLSKKSIKENYDLYGYLVSDEEEILLEYKAMRDLLIFTSKKIIAVDVQGLTGKKKEFLVLPYSKMTAFSVESAGSFDLDAECKLWASGVGYIELKFVRGTDVREISSILVEKVG
ncbi:PH domain-containing protein [Anaerosinus massiliensis]|uniref:PH domain-containing protein n=1 Tax=Massilibacillus massiliensis TaxID=1806837 RepID=UPI000DA5EF6B|nr:PH domain-containing protein [Massilibacillus massiliensis]